MITLYLTTSSMYPLIRPTLCNNKEDRGSSEGVLYREARDSGPTPYPFIYRLRQKRNPFRRALLTNDTPFTCIVSNFTSLQTAVNALSFKTESFPLFHNHKMYLLGPLGLFTDQNERFPNPFIYFSK